MLLGVLDHSVHRIVLLAYIRHHHRPAALMDRFGATNQ
jgi:hypothetical protein